MASARVGISNELALQGIRLADFNAVARVQSAWDDSIELAEDLHLEERNKILKGFLEAPELETGSPFGSPTNPLIEVYTGAGGAGKTQLLSQIRKDVMSLGYQFALVDMTGVNSFYPTVCLHLIQSLLQRTPDGYFQIEHLLAKLLQLAQGVADEAQAIRAVRIAADSPHSFEDLAASIIWGLGQRFTHHPMTLMMHSRRDSLRALLMLGLLPGDERWYAAYNWLQGGELEEAQAIALRLPRRGIPEDIIRAVSWLMSLRAPTLLAFDQLDVMVNQFEAASRGGNTESAAAAKAVVLEIAGGLAALWEQVYRCEILVSCLQETWNVLKGSMLAPVMARFCPVPLLLGQIARNETAERIVALRLKPGYEKVGLHPPYPTWPFAPAFFEVGQTPRALLQKCFAYRRQCLDAGQVTETNGGKKKPSIGPPLVGDLNEKYSELVRGAIIEDLTSATDDSERRFGELLDFLCDLVTVENPPPDSIEARIDLAPGTSKRQVGLHARLRVTLLLENDREEFFCFRAIEHSNPNAFQARLRAAITDSGINLELPFRRLIIVRNRPVPGGQKTSELVRLLGNRGGQILALSEPELRVLVALRTLRGQKDQHFESWLEAKKPLRQLTFVREAFKDYFTLIEPLSRALEQRPTTPEPPLTIQKIKPETPQKDSPIPAASILIGTLLGPLSSSVVELPLGALTRHVLIRAGSGGGKTVLLKRLVESAALSGVPSIVLDPGNDLAFLGDAWPSAPSSWLSDDADRATAYHNQVEVVVWTPGRIGGRPLAFSPLPDFGAVLNDKDDFESAVSMAAGSLTEATGAAKGAGSQLKLGVLTEAIRHFARRGGQTLGALVAFLSDLPPEVRDEVKISAAQKLAQSMADTLQATLLGNKALIPEDRGTSFSEVLGIGAKKTRVSVVSLAGLSDTNGDRLAFVNQLAVELFTWIRKNPAKGPGHMKGLLVVDEARDFIPSVRSTPCKDSLMRVAAQARKYGFGLLMATQNPTDIDHKAAGQCATQFFGRAASPNVVDAMRQAIEERGGSAPDLTQLGKGQFYFSSSESERYKRPVRIQVPICLSYHPDGITLSENDILIRARRPTVS